MPGISNSIVNNIRRGKYRYIGDGSSRTVYDMGNRYVVKIAKNPAGFAQNRMEYYISSIDKSGIFAKVVDVYENFKFLIMEKAEKINNISYVLHYLKKYSSNIYDIEAIADEYDLVLADLTRNSSWGIVRGNLVIIDYGYTRAVKDRFYN